MKDKQVVLLFKLPKGMREQFQKECERQERTMSAQMRMLITNFIQGDGR
jgi:hypothetical protein